MWEAGWGGLQGFAKTSASQVLWGWNQQNIKSEQFVSSNKNIQFKILKKKKKGKKIGFVQIAEVRRSAGLHNFHE